MRLLLVFALMAVVGCNKSPEPGLRARIEQELANKAAYEGRTKDAAHHKQRAEEAAKKHQEYEAWKRANGK